ncbi:MAG: glycyl-radical enzyme activating protein [Bacillota bacterium]
MRSGFVFDIRRYSVHDGPGIRTTVFFKGCPARCAWCHNPESQEPGPEVMFWQRRCASCGACAAACPAGAIRMVNGYPVTSRETCSACGSCVRACRFDARTMVGRAMSVDEVMRELERDRIFYDESGGGATFSGGEPLAQPEFLEDLLAACRVVDIHTAVDTSGIARFELVEKLAPLVDVWLYDIKTVHPALHMKTVGCPNDEVLRNLRLLAAKEARIILRVPVIPGVNDDNESLAQLADLILSLGGRRPERLDLLPYHKIGVDKYLRLGRTYGLQATEEPNKQHIEDIASFFRTLGLEVKIGG